MSNRYLIAFFGAFLAPGALWAQDSAPAPLPKAGGEVPQLEVLNPIPTSYTPPHRFWANGEVLGWAVQGAALPPLVTSSPPGTPQNQAGVLGVPGTQTLYGDGSVNGGLRPGFRLLYGGWFDEGQYNGFDGSFFTLFGGTASYTSPNGPIVSRPFTNTQTGGQAAQLVTLPGVIQGNVATVADQDFYGLDLNFNHALLCGADGTRVFGLAGYRNMGLYEGLSITENLNTLNGSLGIPAGNNIVVQDGFRTINQYNGGQLGLGFLMFGERWMLDARAMLGIGQTLNIVRIQGNTRITSPGGATQSYTGGLLAQQSNIGTYQAQSTSFIPEIRIGGGYRVANNTYLTLGYTFLYWTGVARPGDQIDPVVNPTQIPPGTLQGPARPAGGVNTSDVWIQGISGGLLILF